MTAADDQEWNRWVAWLGEEPGGPSIWDDVVAMVAARQVWDEFSVMHHNAPDLVFRGGVFTSWLKNNYIGRQAMFESPWVHIRGVRIRSPRHSGVG